MVYLCTITTVRCCRLFSPPVSFLSLLQLRVAVCCFVPQRERLSHCRTHFAWRIGGAGTVQVPRYRRPLDILIEHISFWSVHLVVASTSLPGLYMFLVCISSLRLHLFPVCISFWSSTRRCVYLSSWSVWSSCVLRLLACARSKSLSSLNGVHEVGDGMELVPCIVSLA